MVRSAGIRTVTTRPFEIAHHRLLLKQQGPLRLRVSKRVLGWVVESKEVGWTCCSGGADVQVLSS
jgi:hypothetical protein